MQALTPKQRTVLLFIAEHMDAHGFPPTIRELCEGVSIRSTNGVNDHLKALEKKGYITRDAGKSRALKLTPAGLAETGASPERLREAAMSEESRSLSAVATIETIPRVPLLGNIAAGVPIEAIESADELIAIEPSILGRYRPEEVFALKIQGESMIEDGILDGDIVFIRRQKTGNRGETLAVIWKGEATLKRWQPEGDRVVLQPANSAMAPIVIPRQASSDLEILGKAIGLYRRISF